MTTTAIPAARMSSWDRAAIATLGSAGCALSYDALQQIATAIHIRDLLSYLFPVVIDGFIAYGVRALLVLRTAPFRSRLYVWTLFGTATTASVWANALHAIRLNQLTARTATGLRLGDTAVGVLSTIAPLALAGAVHLYILIARHAEGVDQTGLPASGTGQDQRDQADDEPTTAPALTAPADHHEQDEVPGDPAPADAVPESPQPPSRRMGRPPSAEIAQLVAIGRSVASATGSVSRKAVLEAVRAAGHTIGNDRLKEVMHSLETETAATATADNAP